MCVCVLFFPLPLTRSLKSRVKIMVDGTLLISNLIPEDSGNYTCMPTNGLLTPPMASAVLTVMRMFLSAAHLSLNKINKRIKNYSFTLQNFSYDGSTNYLELKRNLWTIMYFQILNKIWKTFRKPIHASIPTSHMINWSWNLGITSQSSDLTRKIYCDIFWKSWNQTQ